MFIEDDKNSIDIEILFRDGKKIYRTIEDYSTGSLDGGGIIFYIGKNEMLIVPYSSVLYIKMIDTKFDCEKESR